MSGGPDEDTPRVRRIVSLDMTDDIRLAAYARYYGVPVTALMRLAAEQLLATLDATRPLDGDGVPYRRKRKR